MGDQYSGATRVMNTLIHHTESMMDDLSNLLTISNVFIIVVSSDNHYGGDRAETLKYIGRLKLSHEQCVDDKFSIQPYM